MPNITIPAADGSGSFSAYRLEPKTRPAGVVVLIQEIFGVNQAMRDTAAWVADLGFIAVCPDLFWRITALTPKISWRTTTAGALVAAGVAT